MIVRLGVFVVLLIAIVFVAIFGYSILDHHNKTVVASAPLPSPTEQVLTTSSQLAAGALIQPNEISSVSVDIVKAPQSAILDTPENRSSITGAMVKTLLTRGSFITNDSIIRPGDHGFLAAVLAPGMRAVTVAVDNVTGADGLIWPGDRVDVLLTQDISGVVSSKSIAAEVVLSNVRVIATGTELIKSSQASVTNNLDVKPASTVTLEVTPEQASRCLVAVSLGTLSLIVHSAQPLPDGTPAPPPAPVWAGQVSPALSSATPDSQSVTTVHVISSNSSGEYKF